ncbi:hypothetical protein MRB53_032436 [Persea americana]|uniref:Uncharacterized protein n=1 Tax=Persea americana TaxID=3435 RepID=A0ACC2KRS7_PERAE|nr:hypothetical protein MRB53_032436 [Persea americana]
MAGENSARSLNAEMSSLSKQKLVNVLFVKTNAGDHLKCIWATCGRAFNLAGLKVLSFADKTYMLLPSKLKDMDSLIIHVTVFVKRHKVTTANSFSRCYRQDKEYAGYMRGLLVSFVGLLQPGVVRSRDRTEDFRETVQSVVRFLGYNEISAAN